MKPRSRLLRFSLVTLASLLALPVTAVTVAIVLLSTQSGSRWALDRTLSLINSDNLHITHQGMEGSFLGGFTLLSPDIQLDESRISAQRLAVAWQPWSILSGTLLLERIHASALIVDWRTAQIETTPPSGDTTPAGEMLDTVLPLPVQLELGHIGADDMAITVDGSPMPLRSLQTGLALHEHHFTITGLQLDSEPAAASGELAIELQNDFALQSSLNWSFRMEDDSLPSLAGRLDVEGDLNVLRLHHELLDPAALTTRGSITLALADMLNQGAVMPAVNIDLQHHLEDLEPVAAGIPVTALEGWRIGPLELVTRGTPENLRIDGNVQLEAMIPGATNAPTAVPATVQWDSRLAGSVWHIERLRAEAGENGIGLSGLIDWSETLAMEAEVELDLPTPASIYPLPGGLTLSELQSSASMQVRMPDEGLEANMNLHELDARLNGQHLSGNGGLTLQDNVLTLDDLLVRSGGNRLVANGRIGDTLDAILQLEIPAIEELYPAARGMASAELILSGNMEQPSILATSTITGLEMAGSGLQSLQLDGRVENEQLDIRLDALNLETGGQLFEQISAHAEGTLQNHNARLEARGTPGHMTVSLSGALLDGDWQGSLDDSLIESDFGTWQQQAAATLSFGTDVDLSRACWTQDTALLCLNGSLIQGELDSRVGLSGLSLDRINHDQADVILRDFHDGGLPPSHTPAPAEVSPLMRLPAAVAVTGMLEAEITVNGPVNDFESLAVRADAGVTDLALYLRQAEDTSSPDDTSAAVDRIVWEQASMTAALNRGQWQAGLSMQLYQNELAGTGVSMRGAATADVTLNQAGALDGRLDLGFDDIAWVEALVPQIRNAAGDLQGSILLGGNIDTPALGAELSLTQARAEVPALGLLLEEVDLQLANPDTDRFVIDATLRSGDGILALDSEILRPFQADRNIRLTLEGDRVQVVNTEELQAAISPQLTLAGNENGLSLDGELHVPVLDIILTELPESAVDVSADTVIVSGSDDVSNAALANRGVLQNIPLRGEIRLTLGDQVHFSGFGLNAGLRGDLEITQRPDATPLAYGELDVVDGRFEMYGQSLEIEQGRLQFLGSYNNPSLDIRAARTVSNTRVGVQINGTALNMRSQLFSTPALPDADVLAMLITGRPLSEAGQQESPSLVGAVARLGINQGQGLTDQIRGQLGLDTLALDAGSSGDLQDSSLTLGKYITPRIFVRYAVGLFDTENTLAIDYTLTESLKLEAQSGESQSLDLIYQMER